MALAHRFAVRNRREALGGVRADGFQHSQPGNPVASAAHEQALGHEPVERVDVGAGDRLRRLHRRAAGERGEAREARLLVVAEQPVAPVDGRAQRLLAGGRVARTPAGAPSAASRRTAISPGERNPQRAAASSIASGSPSSRRQISATARRCPRRIRTPGRAPARARRTARPRRRGQRAGSSLTCAGSANGGTGSAARPARPVVRDWWRAPSGRDTRRPVRR